MFHVGKEFGPKLSSDSFRDHCSFFAICLASHLKFMRFYEKAEQVCPENPKF